MKYSWINRLNEGDLIALFSDGYFEWQNASNEQYGVERLGMLLVKHRERSACEILEIMYDALKEFVGDRPQDDDMTAIIIKRTRP